MWLMLFPDILANVSGVCLCLSLHYLPSRLQQVSLSKLMRQEISRVLAYHFYVVKGLLTELVVNCVVLIAHLFIVYLFSIAVSF